MRAETRSRGVYTGAALKGQAVTLMDAGCVIPLDGLPMEGVDMQVGARKGVWTDLKKPVVAKLTDEDFVSIAAYLSSRTP
jgi:hypothetical protein